ncbi:MAG: phosphate ABC transporter substrate-binding/OmpA family protein [Pseudomonadota bacterium]
MRLNFGVTVAALLFMSAAYSEAQTNKTVILRSFDGFTQLRGDIVSFDGKNFVIDTGLGRITLDALQVECEGEACPESLRYGAKFGIFGSNTIGAELMPMLIDGYAEQLDAQVVRELSAVENESVFRLTAANGREVAEIDLRAHGSGTGYPALAEGQASLGMSSRRMKDEEADLLAANAGFDLRGSDFEHILALDGLLILTHPDNPISAIEIDDVADIFAGVITNWSEVGGVDQEIIVHARDEKSGTYDTFESLVLDPIGESLTPNALRYESNTELSDAVARTPGAIGFSGAAFARAAKVLNLSQACGIVSPPSSFTMKTEEYPFSRRLYLYSAPEDAPAHARRLLDFALSDEAQDLVADAGFINLREERVTIAEQGNRLVHAITGEDEVSFEGLRQMLLELRDAERLTTTFRFNQGSTQLDARSARDVAELAKEMQDGFFDGQEVMLIGFTDSIGQFDLNQSLALRRAEQVRAQLAGIVGPLAFSRLNVRTLGYGELAPVGCNNTFEGRQINRRVEVWVRNL